MISFHIFPFSSISPEGEFPDYTIYEINLIIVIWNLPLMVVAVIRENQLTCLSGHN